MGKYTDEEIRKMSKVTIKAAADYLGISSMMVTLGMRNNLLPIGFAVKSEETYRDTGILSSLVIMKKICQTVTLLKNLINPLVKL